MAAQRLRHGGERHHRGEQSEACRHEVALLSEPRQRRKSLHVQGWVRCPLSNSSGRETALDQAQFWRDVIPIPCLARAMSREITTLQHETPQPLKTPSKKNMNTTNQTIVIAALTAAALTACGSRPPAVVEPAMQAAQTSNVRNTVILPAITYGKTASGLQLTKADDTCDVPASLVQSLQEQLQAPYEFAVSEPSERIAGAPTLRIVVTDILANAGGLYGGPKIVQLHGTLERDGVAPVHFNAQRQSFLHFGLPRSTCNMVGRVTYALGGDIAAWLQEPVDGAKLGEL